MTTTIENWDRTQSWRPRAVHRPTDEAAVARAIRRAAEDGARLKPVGGSLSWSDCADIPGEAMRFDRLARVIRVDPDQHSVTVQGGARLADVNEALASRGLAFDNFGSIVMQTAGGYTGTGSHGTGGRTPILSSYLKRLRLVDGLGEVHELSPDQDPTLFELARVHLGCLGVVTELTFACVDAFDLEERLDLVPFDRLLGDLDRLVETNDYLKLWWFPYTDKVQVYSFNRTDRPRTRRTINEWFDTSGLSSYAFAGILALGRRAPALVPKIHELLQRGLFRPHRRVDRSDKIIRYVGTIPRHQETEYAIDRSRAAEAIDRVRQLVLSARYRVNFPLEVRFTAADDIPMSACRGRDSCWLGPYVASKEWARGYFRDFEALMHDFDGRPHWGKSFSRSADELRALYGDGYDRFDAARRRLDPHGVFRNSFSDRVFPC